MKKLSRLLDSDSHLGARVGLSFGLLIAILISIGWVELSQLRRIDADLANMVDQRWQTVQLSRQAQNYSNINSRLTMQVFLVDDEKEVSSLLAQASGNSERISQLIASLRSRVESNDEAELLYAIDKKRTQYTSRYREALRILVEDKQSFAATVEMQQVLPLLIDYHQAWNDYVDYQGHQMDLARERVVVSGARTLKVTVLLVALGVVFAITIAVFVTRNITWHIRKRKRAEESLRRSHNELEDRIRERTVELAKANQGLEAEILERKQAEADISGLKEFQAAILSGVQHGIQGTDKTGQIVFSNPRAAGMLGWDVNELIGKPAHATMHHHHSDGSRYPAKNCNIYATLRDGQPRHILDEAFWRQDGTSFPVEYRVAPMHSASGEVTGTVVVFDDITERQRAEEVLRESEERYRLLFESNPQPMWVYDLETLAFLAVNDSAVHHYGYSREDFLAMTIKDIRPAEDIPALCASVARPSKAFDAVGSWRHLKKDGTIIEVEITSHLLVFDDRRAELILAHDITERRRAEAERRVIAEIVRGVITTSSLDELFSLAHQAISEVLPAENCYVALNDKTSGLLHVPFCKDEFDSVASSQTLGRGLTAFVLRSGRPMLLTSEYIQELVSKGEIEWVGTLPAAWLGVPLRTSTDIIGVLVVQDYKDKKAYTQRDLEFLSTVGDQIGMAIERRRSEEALKQERIFLRTLIDNIPDRIYAKDLACRKVVANLTETRVLGAKSEAEVLGKDDFAVYPRELAERFFADDQVVLQTGQPVINREEYVIDENGQRIWLLTTKVPLRDEGGQIIGLVGLGRDITERKRTEEAVKASEAKFKDLFHDAPVAYHELDRDGRITGINRTEQQLLGYTAEEMEGRPIWEFIVEKVSREAVERKLSGAVPLRSYECTFIRKDGTLMPVIVDDRQIYDAEGKVTGIRTTLHDMTERKRAEEQLRTSEMLLAESQRIAHLGSFELDLTTGAVNWSDETWRIFGVEKRATFHFNEYLETIHPDDLGFVKAVIKKAKLEYTLPPYHHRIVRPDGLVRVIATAGKFIYGRGAKPAKFVGVHQDVTEQKQMEEELKEAHDTAVESVRLKSEFLANMSHEIRTPMNGVIGMTGLLLDTELTDEQREFAETIRSSGDALLTIINDILSFSKIEAGKLQFETLDFDLSSVVEDTVELLAERAYAKGIELASLIYSDVPTLLRGDPGRFRQVLTNLVSNAIKFTECGEVIVQSEKVSETGTDVLIRFSVVDTGIGISENAQRNLFQAFTQADGSTTRKYGGTGLGLAISKQLVEMMHGEIGVASEAGKGSTFWFTAGFERQPFAAAAIAKPSLLSLDRLRVLIVDDNATNRKILSHQIGSWGMVHDEADSASRALELLHAAAAAGPAYDLAILDLMMPGMDGFDLAKTIKADPKLAQTILVLLTSFGQRGHGTLAWEAGIAAYLTKPVRQSQLFDCLTTAVSQASASRALDTPSKPARRKVITKHSLKETRMMSNKLILLAEDNVINQKVAAGQLLKLGYRADAVANGCEALEALSRIPYDLVLMDCQMPEMDGYEATAEIRHREGVAKHTLIVAMTANALEGDRAKCLAAGMDDYVSKPVMLEELGRVLERLLREVNKTEKDDNHEAPALLPVDMERLVQAMGDEPAERSQILDLYLAQMSKSLQRLKTAIELEEAAEVDLIAHNCAGTSANCGMTAVVGPLRQLETKGRENQLTGAAVLLETVGSEFERVKLFLQEQLEPVGV